MKAGQAEVFFNVVHVIRNRRVSKQREDAIFSSYPILFGR